MQTLGATDDPTPLVAELRALAESPCMLLAAEDTDVPWAWTSALALRTWWQNGGHDWIYGVLIDDGGRRAAGTAPTARHVLAADVSPIPPLAPLLCPAKAVDDGSCGSETAGWALRADHALGRPTSWRTGSVETWCGDQARSAEASPYAVFRSCLNDSADARDMLPLGVFRAPTDGWFIVTESVFISIAGCVEDLAVYDLATGAAYVHRCMRGARPAHVHVGRVPVGAIREAAWMAMLEGTIERHVRPHVQWFTVPDAMSMERRRGERPASRRMLVSVSDMPVQTWSWMRKKSGAFVGQASGSFPLGDAAANHASELLDVAEASFQPGCAPVPPPRSIPWDHVGPPVKPGDENLHDVFDRLGAAQAAIMAAAPGRGPCAPLP
jgi:hypothetical protein